MSTDSTEYKISVTETHEPAYIDGFADGYARAWKECWDYMRILIEEQTEPKPSEAGE
jgi:hypothetical protein